MKVDVYIALNAEMRINTQFENTLANYIESDILTKRLVLLPVDCFEKGLLFTKRLYMMNEVICFS